MITFSQIKQKAEEAYNKNELYEFLTGRNGYDLMVLDAQVDIPTDWTRIIPNGIFALYEEKKDENIIQMYKNAILKAVNSDAFDLWCAIYVLYFQFDQEKQNKAPFLLGEDISIGLKSKILANKKELEKVYPYGKDGWNMYEDIFRLNHNFVTDWGYSFIK